MNKLMAVIFLIGALGCFNMAIKKTYNAQTVGARGQPAGGVRIVPLTQGDQYCFGALGIGCLVASFYFLARTRNDGLRRHPMKAYIIISGAIFGLITVAHIARMFAEGGHVAADPWFLLLTALAAGLCIWGFSLLKRIPRA